jgi:hypothetical protein
MRLVVAMLTCFGVGPIALAETPTPTPPPAAASSLTPPSPAVPESVPAPAPSEAAAPASAAAAAPTVSATGESPKAAATPDHREQLLMARGYRAEMLNGEKVYCKTEQVLGSRIAAKKVCGTVEALQSREQDSKNVAERIQQHQLNPVGN